MPIGLVQDPTPDLDRLGEAYDAIPLPQGARYPAEAEPLHFTQLVGHVVGSAFREDFGIQSDAERHVISADEANDQYGVDGYRRFNAPTTEADAAWLSAQAHERRFRDIVLSRTRPTPLRDFGAGLAGSLFDPAGLAVMFATDGVGEAAIGALGATRTAGEVGLALSKLGRVSNLTAETGGQLAKGALLNAPYVALDAGLSNYAGDDFSMGDALTDIAAGAILHTGLHFGGRSLNALMGRESAGAAAGTPPDAVTALSPESRAGAFHMALDDLADDRPVSVGEHVHNELEAQGEPTGFTTADGAVYALGEDGTTHRGELQARTPQEAEALQLQQRSEATHYLAADDAERLAQVHGEAGAGAAIERTADGYLGVRGPDGAFDGRALVASAPGPTPGLVPVELRDAGRAAHFGHPIAEVRYAPAPPGATPTDLARLDRAGAERARKAGRRAAQAQAAEANSPETRRRIAAVEADPRTQRLRTAADQLKAFAADKRVPGADVLDRLLNDATLKDGHPIGADVEDLLRRFFKDDKLTKLKPRDEVRAALRAHQGFDLSRRLLGDLADRFARNDPGKLDLRAPGRAATPEAKPLPIDLREPAAEPDGKPGKAGEPAKAKPLTGEQLIAADPELKALFDDTERLAAENGIEVKAAPDNQNPNTLAEAIRAAAVCLIGEMG